MNAALGDARKSDVDGVFANIAEKAGVLDDGFTKEAFLASLHDWESAVKPAYAEHKVALGHGVTGRCRNQRRVDGVLTRSIARTGLWNAEARHRRQARPRHGVRVGRGRLGGEAEEPVINIIKTPPHSTDSRRRPPPDPRTPPRRRPVLKPPRQRLHQRARKTPPAPSERPGAPHLF